MVSVAVLEDARIGDVYLSAEEIATRVGELGAEIAADLEGREPVFVGLLKASFCFIANLSRALPITDELQPFGRLALHLEAELDGFPHTKHELVE